MSSSEFVIPSTVYSVQIGPLAGGTASLAPAANAVLAKFAPGVSKVCGVQRVTAGGVPAPVYLTSAVAAAGSTLTLTGAAGDNSTYRVFWTNETAGSLLPC